MPEKLGDQQINDALRDLDGWNYDGERAISKQYQYKDHVAAFGFLTKLAMAAEAMDHHPEIEMVYNKVKVTLSTHSAGGVTQNDLDLAKKAEQYA